MKAFIEMNEPDSTFFGKCELEPDTQTAQRRSPVASCDGVSGPLRSRVENFAPRCENSLERRLNTLFIHVSSCKNVTGHDRHRLVHMEFCHVVGNVKISQHNLNIRHGGKRKGCQKQKNLHFFDLRDGSLPEPASREGLIV